MKKPDTQHQKKSLFHYFQFYIVLFGLLHLLIGGYSSFMSHAPKHLGVETEATLVKKETEKKKKRLIYYYFKYEFQDESGNVHSGRSLINKPFYNSINDGETFALFYIPSFTSARYIPGATGSMLASVIW